MSSIIALPNQSIPDIVVQGCGSMEAAMRFCQDNNISISDYPEVGASHTVSDEARTIGDGGILQYFGEKDIVVGTLGPIPALGFAILLKPVMHVVPADPDPPSVSGFYSYDLLEATGFINVYPIASGDYPSLNNTVSYETEERVIAGLAPATTIQDIASLPMAGKALRYKLPWVVGRGFMMIWSDLGAAEKTATFEDNQGNKAYVGPLIVLDATTQTVEEYLLATLDIELVNAGHNTVQLRLIRGHAPVGHVDFQDYAYSWLHDAVGGTPDPLDPGNDNKTILSLSRGKYTFGVATEYTNVSTTYAPAAFSMVVEIS